MMIDIPRQLSHGFRRALRIDFSPALFPELASQFPITQEKNERFCQGLRVAGGYQITSAAVFDHLGESSDRRGNHRLPKTIGDRDDPALRGFDVWQDHYARAAK